MEEGEEETAARIEREVRDCLGDPNAAQLGNDPTLLRQKSVSFCHLNPHPPPVSPLEFCFSTSR